MNSRMKRSAKKPTSWPVAVLASCSTAIALLCLIGLARPVPWSFRLPAQTWLTIYPYRQYQELALSNHNLAGSARTIDLGSDGLVSEKRDYPGLHWQRFGTSENSLWCLRVNLAWLLVLLLAYPLWVHLRQETPSRDSPQQPSSKGA